MFKKPLKVGAQSQLSGKDKKTLKASLIKLFDQESIEHLCNNTEKILSEKISGSKMLVYMDQDSPLFVDPTGKNDFFPSIYTLMAYPSIIPSVDIFEGVEDNIYKGANLMWPGVSNYSRLGEFEKDGVVGIRNSKGMFIGIGALIINKKDLNEQNKTGICLEILTHYNDKLWDHGSKMAPKVLFEKQIAPVQVQKVQSPQQQKKEKTVSTVKKQQEAPIQQKKEKASKGQDKKGKKKGKKVESQQDNEDQQLIDPPPKKTAVKEQKKPEPVQVKKQQSNEQQSQQEEDLSALLHTKKNVKPTVVKKVQTKKQNVFSDEQDDKKKKKPAKKPTGNQKKEEEQPKNVLIQNDQQQSQEQDFRKGKKTNNNNNNKKKNQGKKQEEEKKPVKGKKRNVDSDEEQAEEVEQVSVKIKPQLMDQYFKEALLNCLTLGFKDKDLPIDSGQFFTEYMQLGKKEGIHLDIKSSSYGKMNKFYEAMSKQGLLEFKQGKQKNGATGDMIIKINRDHDQLRQYLPTVKKMNKRDIEQQKGQKQEKGLKLQFSKTLQVEQVYRPKPFVQQIFGIKLQFQQKKEKKQEPKKGGKKVEQKEQQDQESKKKVLINKNDFFTWQQCKQKISQYLQKAAPQDDKKDKKKQKKDKGQKTLLINYETDEFLKQLLKQQIQDHQQELKRQAEQEEFEKGKPEEQQEVEQQVDDKKKKKQDKRKFLKIEKQQFEKAIQKYLEAFHRLIDKPNNVLQFRQGKFKGVQVIAEKANNKNVTRIVGSELILIPKPKVDQQVTNLSNVFKQKFASSVTVHNIPGRYGGKQISIQGTFLDQVVDYFEEYGVSKELITQVNKLDKKKKN